MSSKKKKLTKINNEVDVELTKLGQAFADLMESVNAPAKRLADVSAPFQRMLDAWQIQEDKMKEWMTAVPDLHQLITERIQLPELMLIPKFVDETTDIEDEITTEEDVISAIDGRILEQLPTDSFPQEKITFCLTPRGDLYREGFPDTRLCFRGRKVLALLRAISPRYKQTKYLKDLSGCKDEPNVSWQFRKVNGLARKVFGLKNRFIEGAPGPGYRLAPGYKVRKCTTE